MPNRRFLPLLAAGAMLLASAWSHAAGGGALQSAGNDLGDQASLQRGAQLFTNYCAGCHSLKYLRYSRMAEDLGLSEEQVQSSLNFSGAAFGEHITTPMPPAAEKWFGKLPPDLSLVARVRGNDWLYTYLLSFYQDEQAVLGWNNQLFPDVAMPNALWELQGLQRPVYAPQPDQSGNPQVVGVQLAAPGAMEPAQFKQAARDITNFLAYAAEPAALKRQTLGVWVILFLVVFTLLAWMLKREYWKDVH